MCCYVSPIYAGCLLVWVGDVCCLDVRSVHFCVFRRLVAVLICVYSFVLDAFGLWIDAVCVIVWLAFALCVVLFVVDFVVIFGSLVCGAFGQRYVVLG